MVNVIQLVNEEDGEVESSSSNMLTLFRSRNIDDLFVLIHFDSRSSVVMELAYITSLYALVYTIDICAALVSVNLRNPAQIIVSYDLLSKWRTAAAWLGSAYIVCVKHAERRDRY